MPEIHRDILDNWGATDWEEHSVKQGVTKFTLKDVNGNTIVTDSLLGLSNSGHDKGNSDKNYKKEVY